MILLRCGIAGIRMTKAAKIALGRFRLTFVGILFMTARSFLVSRFYLAFEILRLDR